MRNLFQKGYLSAVVSGLFKLKTKSLHSKPTIVLHSTTYTDIFTLHTVRHYIKTYVKPYIMHLTNKYYAYLESTEDKFKNIST